MQNPPLASFPGLHAQLLSLAVGKVGKAWTDLSRDACCCWLHVQFAHILVCSPPFTLLSLNSVCSFFSVCPVSPIATWSIMASYSTWRQQRHASRDKSVQAYHPAFRTASDKSWAWRPGNIKICEYQQKFWCLHKKYITRKRINADTIQADSCMLQAQN